MDAITLEVQSRNAEENAKNLLAQGFIPAEFYGKGMENLSFKMDYQTFRRVFVKAGSNTIIDLVIDGKKGPNVLVGEVQYHPVNGDMIHVDFRNVKMDQEITTQIPLAFVGTAPAVKTLAGIFMAKMDEVEVKCLPSALVHSIEVSIDSLEDFHCYVRVKDLKVPAGIVVLNEPEDVVAVVVAPRAEEEAPVVAAVPAEGEAAVAEGEAVPAEGVEAKGETPAKGEHKGK
ncbi:50S ribosomal protein L25 [Candidatus Gracilibacteria bacterium]|nr:50S ribosomal protein L25 [Candidatus Gracilibacteria bacterium]